jgi:hypothetical protein
MKEEGVVLRLRRIHCPVCDNSFDLGLSAALNLWNRRLWKVYCPRCFAMIPYRYGGGSVGLVAIALTAVTLWASGRGVLPFFVFFASWIPVGILVAALTPIDEGKATRTGYRAGSE